MATEVPLPPQWTVCESQCRLVHTDWSNAASTSAPGASYPCISVPPSTSTGDNSLQGSAQPQAYIHAGGEFREYSGVPFSRQAGSRSFTETSSATPVTWHPLKPFAAVLDRQDRALVYDMGPYEATPKNGAAQAHPAAVDQPRMVLQHELQAQACSVAWRPHCGSQLAVGCQGGIALWCVSGSSRAPVAGSRPADGPVAAGSRPGGGRGPWLTFLPASGSPGARLTDLAWSPDGRLLAAASPQLRGLLIWDVATGAMTRVAAGFSLLRLLRWAPGGGHLFAASHGSLFYLFETSRWTYQAWDAAASALPLPLLRPSANPASASASSPSAAAPSTAAALINQALGSLTWLFKGGQSGASSSSAPSHSGLGRLVNAAWSPSSRIVLMAFAGSQALLALHIVGDAPSLQAQPMPVPLPDVQLTSHEPGAGRAAGTIADFAWDARGERLGVLLGGSHPAAGCIAVFSTASEPVVHARLLGFARPPPAPAGNPGAAAAGAAGDVSAGATGAGEGWTGAWTLSAHPCFSRGSLFTLRLGEALAYNLPMYR